MSRTLWLTGLSGSGKTTLAHEVDRALQLQRRACVVLDGDTMCGGLCNDLDFSLQGRRENIRRVAEVAQLCNQAGLLAIVALISPLSADRALARRILGVHGMLEIYLSAPLSVCQQRDPKGFYKRAHSTERADPRGVNPAYQPPRRAHLVLDTSALPIADCTSRVLQALDASY
jgi:adenylylsulfate kinase